jgi:hypothetical protein
MHWDDVIRERRHSADSGCGKTLPCYHSEPFAVILSIAKDLALPAQDKVHEEFRPAHLREHTRFFVACGSSE